MNRIPLSTLIVALATALGVGSLQAAPALSVVGYELAAQRRISSTVYEYRYRIQVHNTGTAAQDVTVDLRSMPPGVTTVDHVATIARVEAGAIATSDARIVIRHDRTKPFQFGMLGWVVRGQDGTFTGRLGGSPSAPALESTHNFVAAPAPGHVVDDGLGNMVELTEILLTFSPTATVAQVNAALDTVGGTIIGMGTGQRSVELRIADPGSVASLNSRIAALLAMPGVSIALPSPMGRTRVLPSNPPFLDPTHPAFYQDNGPTIALSKYIDEHLAVRAYAAWNLAGMLETPVLADRRPVMIYEDYFNSTPPDLDY